MVWIVLLLLLFRVFFYDFPQSCIVSLAFFPILADPVDVKKGDQ